MRHLLGSCVLVAIWAAAIPAQAEKPAKLPKPQKETRHALPPKLGIKIPGVQIPIESLKAELEYETPAPPRWLAFTDTVLFPDVTAHSLARIDPKAKERKFGDPITGIQKPCAGLVNAFGSLWTGDCSEGALVRIDPKTGKVTAKVPAGIGPATIGLAATADSIWLLTDARGTLSRIDPEQNQVVAELRVPADCTSLAFGETVLWLACPAESRVLRVDPVTNLVEKSIEVAALPEAVAVGEGSIWVLCAKEGKLERIDPKTNKVSKTIDLGAPAAGGSLAIGEKFAWVSMPGFPITRIDPGTDKVVQQFYGDGGAVLGVGLNFVWLANLEAGTLWKLDPRRIAATLAE